MTESMVIEGEPYAAARWYPDVADVFVVPTSGLGDGMLYSPPPAVGTRHNPRVHVSRTSRPRERRDGSSKNSTRGSPSDDDDPSDPVPRICAFKPCGASLVGKRAGAKYCDDACRVAAHREKKSSVPRTLPVLRLVEDDRYSRSYESGFGPDGSFDVRDRLKRRAQEGCRCGTHSLPDRDTAECLACGRPQQEDIEIWKRLADAEARQMSLGVGPRPLSCPLARWSERLAVAA